MLNKMIVELVALSLLALPSCLAAGPSSVFLGSAGNFVILAKAGVSTVPNSRITGDIGLSPAASTALTGFSTTRSALGTTASSSQVTGSLSAADFTSPTPVLLGTAVGDMMTAFTDAAGRSNPTSTNLGAGSIGGLTLAPGLYKWTSGVNIATDLTLSGNSFDTWIFQISGTFTTASKTKIILAGGALPKNIVWVVSGAVSVGSGARFEGVILGATSVVLDTGASMHGRIFAQTAATLQKAILTQPAS